MTDNVEEIVKSLMPDVDNISARVETLVLTPSGKATVLSIIATHFIGGAAANFAEASRLKNGPKGDIMEWAGAVMMLIKELLEKDEKEKRP